MKAINYFLFVGKNNISSRTKICQISPEMTNGGLHKDNLKNCLSFNKTIILYKKIRRNDTENPVGSFGISERSAI